MFANTFQCEKEYVYGGHNLKLKYDDLQHLLDMNIKTLYMLTMLLVKRDSNIWFWSLLKVNKPWTSQSAVSLCSVSLNTLASSPRRSHEACCRFLHITSTWWARLPSSVKLAANLFNSAFGRCSSVPIRRQSFWSLKAKS